MVATRGSVRPTVPFAGPLGLVGPAVRFMLIYAIFVLIYAILCYSMWLPVASRGFPWLPVASRGFSLLPVASRQRFMRNSLVSG